MRYLIADSYYFDFLDNLRTRGDAHAAHAPGELLREFPNLRSEEARAIFADWRASYHDRHSR